MDANLLLGNGQYHDLPRSNQLSHKEVWQKVLHMTAQVKEDIANVEGSTSEKPTKNKKNE